MSADADHKHGSCSQPCAMCHAEEVARLTAELAEARKAAEHWRQKRIKDREKADGDVGSAIAEVGRAHTERDAVQAEAAAWKELHDKHCGAACCEGIER